MWDINDPILRRAYKPPLGPSWEVLAQYSDYKGKSFNGNIRLLGTKALMRRYFKKQEDRKTIWLDHSRWI